MSSDFGNFMLEYNVIGVSLGTIVGFGLTNWTRDFKNTVLTPVINKYGINEYGDLVATSVEVIFLFMLIYVIYILLVRNMITTALDEQDKQKEKEKKWKDNILDEIKMIKKSNKEVKAYPSNASLV